MMPHTFIGTTEEVKFLLFGNPQHDEHMRAWRWKMYCQDDSKRWASVEAALKKMHAERRVAEDAAELQVAE